MVPRRTPHPQGLLRGRSPPSGRGEPLGPPSSPGPGTVAGAHAPVSNIRMDPRTARLCMDVTGSVAQIECFDDTGFRRQVSRLPGTRLRSGRGRVRGVARGPGSPHCGLGWGPREGRTLGSPAGFPFAAFTCVCLTRRPRPEWDVLNTMGPGTPLPACHPGSTGWGLGVPPVRAQQLVPERFGAHSLCSFSVLPHSPATHFTPSRPPTRGRYPHVCVSVTCQSVYCM